MSEQNQQAQVRMYLLPIPVGGDGGSVFCLFSQNQVVEILGRRPVLPIPSSPVYLYGVIGYHDSLLPVIGVHELCGGNGTGGRERIRQLVVIRTGAIDPRTGEPLKAALATGVGMRLAKLSRQALASGFVESDAPSVLRESGLLRGFFQRQKTGVAVLDFGRLVLGGGLDA